MKKKVLLLAITAICVSILAGGTWAYNTADQKVHNVITSNAVDIEIEEWQEKIEKLPIGGGTSDDGFNGEFIPMATWTSYPKESIAVMPSVTVSKIATVKNNDADAYIRAKYEIVIKNKNGEVLKDNDGNSINADVIKNLVNLANEGISSGTKLPQGVDIQSGTWLSKDGDSEWLYYSVPVPTGKSTEPLFTKVEFSGPNIDNKYQECTIEVKIITQGVQYANQNVTDVKDVQGWPADTASTAGTQH